MIYFTNLRRHILAPKNVKKILSLVLDVTKSAIKENVDKVYLSLFTSISDLYFRFNFLFLRKNEKKNNN